MKSTSIRTPLAGARGLGAAKSGTEHWWEQRLTSIALVPLTFAAVVIVISTIGRDYVAVAHMSPLAGRGAHHALIYLRDDVPYEARLAVGDRGLYSQQGGQDGRVDYEYFRLHHPVVRLHFCNSRARIRSLNRGREARNGEPAVRSLAAHELHGSPRFISGRNRLLLDAKPEPLGH